MSAGTGTGGNPAGTTGNAAAPEGTPIMHINGFSRGKGKFVITEYVATDEKTGPRYPLLLTTGRILFHFHSGSMTRRSGSLLEKEGRGWVAVNERDAEELGLAEGEAVRLTSRRGTLVSRAHISSRLQRKNVFATFHFGEEGANLLTNPALDPKSKMADLKVCAVRLERVEGGG